ncbi:hypothetical protein LIA77_09732 [Sarocladium implicatum]|nr:hypothetical protein LIA77_09732 [Sarocladium implicatum]
MALKAATQIHPVAFNDISAASAFNFTSDIISSSTLSPGNATINMSSPSPAHIRSLYRSLLRELPPRPILSRPRAPLHARLRQTFDNPPPNTTLATTASSSSTRQLPAEHAEQLIAYLRSQRTYAQLLDRYNPGMNMDDEERVRLTARKVGMDLPKEFMVRLDKK